MDPLSALSLAGNIISFIDFSAKLISGAAEVYGSATGTTTETREINSVVRDLQLVTRRLSPQNANPSTDDEIALQKLVLECRQLSEELLAELDKLRAKNPHSKTAGLRIALRGMMKKGQLESLENRLERYRNVILSRVVMMMSEKQSSVYDALQVALRKTDVIATETRDTLQAIREDFLQSVQEMQDAALDQHPNLSDISNALTTITATFENVSVEDWVLSKLKFSSMRDREHGIHEACEDTYKWLIYSPDNSDDDSDNDGSGSGWEDISDNGVMSFDESSTPASDTQDQTRKRRRLAYLDGTDKPSHDELDIKRSAHRSLVEWLEAGSGIFYISGKAGSGKSTLMKFLYQDSQTEKMLRKWAGGKKLVMASFFFWNSGDGLQKSIEGLYRSILFETLRECPGLIPETLPSLWQAAKGHGRHQMEADEPISMIELERAFVSLTTSTKKFEKHRFCFFIDGLDEFEGDYWSMAKALRVWTSPLAPGIRGSEDIKICVSSRPYSAFESFSLDPKLSFKLHDLTREDMEIFVRSQFSKHPACADLGDSVREYQELMDQIVMLSDGVFLWTSLATLDILDGIGDSYSIIQLQEKLKTVPTGLSAVLRKIWNSIKPSDKTRALQTFALAINRDVHDLFRENVLTYSIMDDLQDRPAFAKEVLSKNSLFEDEKGIIDRVNAMRKRLNGRCKGLLEVTDTEHKVPLFRYKLGFIHRSAAELLGQEMVAELPDILGDLGSIRLLFHTFIALFKSPYYFKFAKNREEYRLLWHSLDFAWLADIRQHTCLLPELVDFARRQGSRELASFRGALHVHITTGGIGRFVSPHGLLGDSYAEYSFDHHAASIGLFAFVSRRVNTSPELLSVYKDLSLLVSSSLGASWRRVYGVDPSNNVKLTRFLLDCGAQPNEELPASPLLQSFRGGDTPWKLFLVGSLMTVRPNEYRPEVVDLIEAFLTHGADPHIRLLGFVADGYDTAINFWDRKQPYFMTLEQLIDIWAPPNAEAIKRLLPPKNTTVPEPTLTLAISAEPKSAAILPFSDFHRLNSGFFFCVADVDNLDMVDPEQFKRSANSLLGYQHLNIRIF